MKKILVPYSVQTRPGQENSEKNTKKIQKMKKLLSSNIFKPKQDEVGQESEKKILVPNSVHSRPGKENSEKNSQKLQKINKPLSSISFSRNGMR